MLTWSGGTTHSSTSSLAPLVLPGTRQSTWAAPERGPPSLGPRAQNTVPLPHPSPAYPSHITPGTLTVPKLPV